MRKLKVYIAAPSEHRYTVQQISKVIEEMDVSFTFKWWENYGDSNDWSDLSVKDCNGVREADLIIAVSTPLCYSNGMFFEIGMAVALEKPVWAFTFSNHKSDPNLFFLSHPSIDVEMIDLPLQFASGENARQALIKAISARLHGEWYFGIWPNTIPPEAIDPEAITL